ncbi:hypothetical protein C0992_003987, partial [Termitomyces sp. T32_za158]
IEALAHLGISISTSTIHTAIMSLSAESAARIRAMGQTMLVAYAYDNFDVDLKKSIPTAETSAVTLKHLTSALMFPLQHGITQVDMQCSEELWKKSRLNPNATTSDLPAGRTWKDLIDLIRIQYPEISPSDQDQNGSQLTRHERFMAWKFLYDLCHYGPPYFAQFCEQVSLPTVIEQIPIIKTPILPVRAMEFSNSTISGNISSIKNILNQAGVGDPNDPEISYEVKDATLYIIMFHGDLGTGDRIFSIQLRRSVEKTPWNRFQYVVFVPGVFHIKMACANALWRLLISPQSAREDKTSLMHDIAKLRPRETGIIGSNPDFRRMHQVISHAGIGRRLDCWRIEATRLNAGHRTLNDFAASKPTFDQISSMAIGLPRLYVADFRTERLLRQPAAQRDQQNENALLVNKYFLLYEEISHAMNYGDIGRLETCLLPWIFIFKATGKHKYASHMMTFLCNVHFVYPAGLKKAVCLHVLVNPTGKPGKFRGVDWCVELNNLYTKAIHGGGSSNYTIERIIKESPLIQTYRDIKHTIEWNFMLTHLTTAHGETNMVKTFAELQKHLAARNTYKKQPGRQSAYVIPDAIDKGRMMLQIGDATDAMEDDVDLVSIKDVLGELV